MEPDPSLLARIYEWFLAVVWNLKGFVAGLSLASGFVRQQLLSDKSRQRLDRILPSQWHRRILIWGCLLLLGVSLFQVYDGASTKLRRLSAELPDFEKATAWSVTFEAVSLYGAIFLQEKNSPVVFLFHRCRFANLSATRKRILDVRIDIPTADPTIPVLTLNTESMSFQAYRKSLTDKGIAVGESALGRKESLIQTPIVLEPAELVQGTIEFDDYNDKVKQKMLNAPPVQELLWLRVQEATVSVTDQISDITKTITIGDAYNAATGTITKAGEHYLLR